MILREYCVIYPEYFTPREVEIIHSVADTIELIPGMVGNIPDDPDAPDGEDTALMIILLDNQMSNG